MFLAFRTWFEHDRQNGRHCTSSKRSNSACPDVRRCHFFRPLVVELEPRLLLAADFGDAPDNDPGPPNFPTFLVSDGARHTLGSGLFLGSSVDAEQDGQPTPLADGDDTDGNNDNDGLTLNRPLVPGQFADFSIESSDFGLVDAWLDVNGDGTWTDPDEKFLSSAQVIPGENIFLVPLPETTVLGLSYARFRVSSTGGLLPTGLADDGEVEDYAVLIETLPAALDDVAQAISNTPVNITVLDNDLPTSNLEIVSFQQPADGEVTDNGDGTLNFISAAGFSGNTNFDYVMGFAPQSLNGADSFNRDEFGNAAALDGERAVIGARLGEDSPTANNSGLAYVFERTDGVWSEVAKLAAADPAGSDFFGSSVAIDGDTVVVGAPLADDAFTNSGAAYVFQKDQGGSDSWGQVAKLVNPTPAGSDQFGTSVSVSGDTIAVGAWLDDDPARAGSNHGSVSLFGRDVGGVDNWGLIATIFNSVLPAGAADKFGFSVSLDGDTLAAGAHHVGGGNEGAVFVHQRNQGGTDAWGEVRRIDNPEPNSGDQFGWSVSLDADTLAVGNPFDDTPITGSGINAGSTFVFGRDIGGTDNWGQVKKLTPDPNVDRDTNEANDRFGLSVSLDGDSLAVGAPFTNAIFGSDGVAYQFHRDEGGDENWGAISVSQPADAGPGDRFGSSVAASGLLAAFGAPKDDAPGVDTGSALFVSQETDTATVTVNVVASPEAPLGIPAATDGPSSLPNEPEHKQGVRTESNPRRKTDTWPPPPFKGRRFEQRQVDPVFDRTSLRKSSEWSVIQKLAENDLSARPKLQLGESIRDEVLAKW